MASLYDSFRESVFRKLYGEPFSSAAPSWAVVPDVAAPSPSSESRFDSGPSVRSVTEQCSGLVLVADGVGGLDLCGTGLRYVLGSLKSTLAVHVVPWGHGLGRWHADLTRVSNRRVWAERLAAAVESFHQQHPEAPIFLVAKSGGSGIVINALELLPADRVERVVLLAPALSPRYDLSRSLQAVRRELHVFWSPLDFIILGAGTQIFGTIDRRHSASAGLVGFRSPIQNGSPVDPGSDSYTKLRQVRWQTSMMTTGYFGGHLGPDSPAFLRKYIAPLLRADRSF